MEQDQNKQEQEMVEIPHAYLTEGVRQAVGDIRRMLSEARAKHGPRYNWKNDYETFGRRFGWDDPERIWQEYALVCNNRSKEPGCIRKIIKVIGGSARYNAIGRMRQEMNK